MNRNHIENEDGAEVYDDMILGDGVYLDEEINVDDLEQYDGEYIQLENGDIIPAPQDHEHLAAHVQGNVRGNQNDGHVYTIRGSQVFRVEKTDPSEGEGMMVANKSSDNDVRYSHHIPSSSGTPMSINTLHRVDSYQTQNKEPFTSQQPQPSNVVRNVTIQRTKKRTPFGSKKPCNCTKSMCLKLYCDCFANGEFCRDCNCKDCHNNMDHEVERSRAIKQSLERNPNAFKPKIGVTGRGRTEAERLHQKGCHCKKSGCLKNYCECYEAKVACTDRCKCRGCRNTETDRINKAQLSFSSSKENRLSSSGLLSLANVATGGSSANSTFSDEDSEGEVEKSDPKTLPWFYMTDEVIEATTNCMVAQADEVLSSGGSDELMERCILSEFAGCLRQIIENATTSHAANANSVPSWDPAPPLESSHTIQTLK